jgi:UDP-N-acetylmuramoylalanine--D-glutamate ligase
VPDLASLTSWHSNWRGLKVAVLGLGVSGFSVADTLAELGCEVLAIGKSVESDIADLLDVIGVAKITGEGADQVTDQLVEFAPELVVTSPGFRPDAPILKWAAESKIVVWTDIDLAWRLRDKTERIAKWVCITGTNGKTTTTQLTCAMLIAGGLRAVACGNIGEPILNAIRDPEGYDAIVVELSSFQLHYLGYIEPYASAILNVADDHLDWHGSRAAYEQAKGKIYEHAERAIIYNVADSVTLDLAMAADVQSEETLAVAFTTGFPADLQVGFVEESLIDRGFSQYRAKELPELANLHDLAEIGIVTPHLKANVAAAAALARALDVSPESIRTAIRTFRLDAHRIELVASAAGVTFVDDSKATNPHAAAASLASFDSVVWLVGGLLKGVNIAPLVAENSHRLKGAVVIGLDREPVLAALRASAPDVPVVEIEDAPSDSVMTRAVDAASVLAEPGDTVLLAPAAASMDQFRDYADRGNSFAAAVKKRLSIS